MGLFFGGQARRQVVKAFGQPPGAAINSSIFILFNPPNFLPF